VQEGHDLRHFTGQVLNHFRDLLLVLSAPNNPAVLDASPEQHARLASQAAKFSVAELSRILALLVAASTDMRWTTSPRLTLELALVRAALPEADPNPSGLGARIERLERLAGVVGASSAGDMAIATGPQGGDLASSLEAAPPPAPEADRESESEPVVVVPEPAPEADGEPVATVGHAPSAESLDVGAIRRSWPQLLAHLAEKRQMVLKAHLESATAAAYDGALLELAFPPGRSFAVEKVTAKEPELREAFVAVFGISPRIVCVERGGPIGAVGDVVDEEDEPPPDPKSAVERLKAEFGAELEPEGGDGDGGGD
jgi:DNA polymerase-3 subunit gamma/tau